ncbi:MAG: NADH-quinone oxidoreductase subunit N, partial [Coriobacteriia bacterium]
MTLVAWFALSPVLVAVAGGILAMLADAFVSRRAAVVASALGLLLATGLALYAYLEVAATRISPALLGAGNFASAAVVIFALSALSLIGGARSLAQREPGGGVAALIAFAAAGCALLASSLDLTMSLIALEIIAVCSYALVASARTPRSAEAAMKYAIQGAVATGLFLMGLAIHVGVLAGSGDFVAGAAAVGSNALPAAVTMTLLFAAYAFKLGAVPFHSWAPDAFETAPPPASAFMASAPKFAAAYGLFLVLAVTFEPFASGPLNPAVVLAGIALLSVVLGNLAALRQTSYTRMLGYSGIAQVGYALIGMTVGQVAFAPSLFLLTVYGLAVVGAFIAAEAVATVRPKWNGDIAGMAGLGRSRPHLAVATSVLMFSLTGIPLT